MFDAHKGLVRDSLLRGAGVISLVSGGLLMSWLFNSVGRHQHQDASLIEFGAAAVGFLCLSAGAILTTLGEHVFDRVEISERWARRAYDLHEQKRGTPLPAFLAMPDNDFVRSTSQALSSEPLMTRPSAHWNIGVGNARR